MDRDIEQAADLPAEADPEHPGYAWTREHHDTAAAAGQVPAEATRAATRVLFERGWSLGDPAREDDYDNEDIAAALAAAAPLIAAAQQRATPAVVAALDEAGYTMANLRAEVDRLTAEREAVRKLVEEALHLCTYGERAPGGDETWADWARRAEAYLRDTPGGPR